MEPREVAFEVAGDGPAVVLIHSDVADARLWDGQVEALAGARRVVTYDRPGFGRTPLAPGPFSQVEDLRGLLDRLGIERASLVGCSGGGAVALEHALAYPDRVDRLALVAPALGGFEGSAELDAADEEETRLFEAGDLDGAAAQQARLWAVGRREAEDVDAELQEYTRQAVRRSYELYVAAEAQGEVGPSARPDPPAIERLEEVRAPTLVVVGEADLPDFHAIADLLAARIPGARKEVVADAAHMLPRERPEELNRLLLDFLA